jgi:hypothetical protein
MSIRVLGPESQAGIVPATVVDRPAAPRAFTDVLGAPVQAAAAVAGGGPLALSALGALAGRAALPSPTLLAQGLGQGLGAGSLSGDPVSGILASSANQDGNSMAEVAALESQSQEMNVACLALQEQEQSENRSYSTLSNVLMVRHETAKAAISNIRS